MCWNNCIVDDTDGMDCRRRRTGGVRSVMAGISRHSDQNSLNVSILFDRQLSAVSQCGEHHSRST